MPSSVKNTSKTTQHSSSGSVSKFHDMYALLRDQATDELCIVPHKEIISAKNLAKLAVGDIVSHGKRDKRIRAEIVLLGNKDQCEQSLQIINRIETASTQVVNKNKKPTFNKINGNEEQVGNEEQTGTEDELVEERMCAEVGESEEELSYTAMEENEESLDDQMEKENIIADEVVPSSQALTNSYQQSPSLNTESSITLKRKTLPSEHDTCALPDNKRRKSTSFVSMKEYAKVVAQLAAADEQLQLYQTTWMPRPVDKATILYLIQMGKVLSDDLDENLNVYDGVIDPGDLLYRICLALDMTEEQLNANCGKTILSTARQIIGAKYPDPTTVYADVKKEHIQAIIEFAWLTHPLEKKLNDAAKLRHAMGNVFASRTFLRKLKCGDQSSKSSS